jgi:lipopolysaccharide export system protein LptA
MSGNSSRKKPLLAALILSVGSLAAPLAAAPPGDAPILIEADRAELDQGQRQSVYVGNVRVTQGAAVFTGDRVVLNHTAHGKPQQVEVTGNPAHFSQPADPTHPAMEAKALTMQYQSELDRLELTGEAWVRQGSDEVSGKHLIYDRRNQRILANSEEGGEGRVHITIQPHSSSESSTP